MSIMDALDRVNVLCPPAPYSALSEELTPEYGQYHPVHTNDNAAPVTLH